jgi:hypothetical protein
MASISGEKAGPAVASAQNNWRWRCKCQCLFFTDIAVCPTGGVHNQSTSGDYSIMQSGGQKDWKWCKKWQVLSFTDVVIGPCSGGKVHDLSQSANYGLLGSGAWIQG